MHASWLAEPRTRRTGLFADGQGSRLKAYCGHHRRTAYRRSTCIRRGFTVPLASATNRIGEKLEPL